MAGRSSIPSRASSSAMAPNMVSAFFSFSRASSFTMRGSGRRSKRFLGAICPTMTQCLMSCSWKNLMSLLSCPTRNHLVASTWLSRSGLVSFLKAATAMCWTWFFRASSTKVGG